jgi:tellurite resistance protein
MNSIEVILFNILHMFMNCDFVVSNQELKLIETAMEELTDEEKEIVESQRKKNETIVSKGFDNMKSRTLEMGKLINDMKNSKELKKSFIEVIKVLILVDGIIHKNEKLMFEELCDLWNIKTELESV